METTIFKTAAIENRIFSTEFNYSALPDVMSYKNRDLVERLEKKLDLSHVDAELLFSDLLKFLALCGLQDRGIGNIDLVPPKMIDEAWHNFLLFSRDYDRFCHRYFGCFVHHQPSTSLSPLRGNRIPQTIALAAEVFGESLSKNWSKHWLGNKSTNDCDGGTTNCQACYK
jgi:hypothetical protein